MSSNKSIIKNTIFYGIKVISSMIIPIITFPYISRTLTPVGIGQYNFANSIISYFVSFAGLGIASYAIREGSKVRHQPEKINKFATEVFTINLISTICSLMALVLAVLVVPKFSAYRDILLILAMTIPLATIGVEWIFNIYEDYLYITLRSLAFQVVSVVLLFLCVRSSDDLVKYCIILVFSNSGANILNFIRARRYISFKPTIKSDLKRHLKPIFILFFSAIATQIYVNSDTVMLGFMTSDYEVGIYAAATKIYNIVRSLLATFVTVITPNMSYLFENEKKQYEKQFKMCFQGFLLALVPISIGGISISKEIIILLSGEEYIAATPALQILFGALFVSTLGSYYANEVLVISRNEKRILKATMIGGITNILGNFVAIHYLGFVGAAITTIISEAVVFTIQLFMSKKIANVKVLNLECLKVTIAGIAIGVICMIVKGLFSNLIIRFVLCIGFSAMGYYLLLCLMKHEMILYMNKWILKKIRRGQ